jgi:tRNA (guanine37-N1)-methyltransferase
MTHGPAEMLRVDVITLFPRMIDVPVSETILGKAQQRGLLRVRSRDLRPYGIGRHQITDDVPYGGGAGMVMKPEPLVAAIEAARADLSAEMPGGAPPRVILLDPQGLPFVQSTAERLAQETALILICGRYEGVDERVRAYVDEELSLGDFILSGGEPAAVCLIDAVARLRPGVLGNEASVATESFTTGLLEGPQFTRPVEFRGERVPEVLLSGDHAKIARWRHEQALARTQTVRPEGFPRGVSGLSGGTGVKQLPFQGGQGIAAPPEAAREGRPTAPAAPLAPVGASGPGKLRNAGPGESQSAGEGNAQEGD